VRYSGIQQIQLDIDIVSYKRDIVDTVGYSNTVGYSGYAAKWLDIIDGYRDTGKYRLGTGKYRFRQNIQKIHSRGGLGGATNSTAGGTGTHTYTYSTAAVYRTSKHPPQARAGGAAQHPPTIDCSNSQQDCVCRVAEERRTTRERAAART